MLLMESSGLFENVYLGITRGVTYQTIYVSVFHDQYYLTHKGKTMETFKGTILDFSR